MTIVERAFERLGLPAPEPERTLWLIGNKLEPFEAMAATIEATTSRFPRLRILLSSYDSSLSARLSRRFPNCRVLAPPPDNGFFVRLFLQRCDVRVAAFLEPEGDVPAALLTTLKHRAVTTLAISARGAARLAPGRRMAAVCESLIEIADTEANVGADDVRHRHLTTRQTVELLGELLARDLKQLRQLNRERRGLGAGILALARNPIWRWMTSWRLERYSSISELRDALGAPDTILCLGNGPSSEDPILPTMKYDALFRVNHSWLNRGILTKPDVVFTGGKPTMRAVRNAIFGFQTGDAEERFAVIRGVTSLVARARFFNANEMTGTLRSYVWGALRPTNGASMLAVAVALRPARLIVAGIDLFQHQSGTYPGDMVTPNAYSPGHSRDTELDFLLNLFSIYDGELSIVGEALRSEWERFRNDAGQRQIDP
ncbi:MAG: hypothetical protein O7G13_12095 [Alphaproteobacteria bacterium]|nr:hypothetical protein [Alphaproteobacteria bacterium]